MNKLLNKLYLDDCLFINSIVTKIKTIIVNCGGIQPPPGQNKVVAGKALEYTTTAAATDVYTLSIDGYIRYIYYQAYKSIYPEIPNDTEKDKIYEIYDVLGLDRPKL